MAARTLSSPPCDSSRSDCWTAPTCTASSRPSRSRSRSVDGGRWYGQRLPAHARARPAGRAGPRSAAPRAVARPGRLGRALHHRRGRGRVAGRRGSRRVARSRPHPGDHPPHVRAGHLGRGLSRGASDGRARGHRRGGAAAGGPGPGPAHDAAGDPPHERPARPVTDPRPGAAVRSAKPATGAAAPGSGTRTGACRPSASAAPTARPRRRG